MESISIKTWMIWRRFSAKRVVNLCPDDSSLAHIRRLKLSPYSKVCWYWLGMVKDQ
ncbi:hypothetical protein C5167_044677 [Papaver somniferum]|nr:hypothetical protein C5167_044677 [Papaver somniferum]